MRMGGRRAFPGPRGVKFGLLFRLCGSLYCRLCSPAQSSGQPAGKEDGEKALRLQGRSLVPCILQHYCRYYYTSSCDYANPVSRPGALRCSSAMDLAFLSGPAPHWNCHPEGFPGRASPVPDSCSACQASKPGCICFGDKRDLLLDS